jgi:RNA-binding protein
MVTLTSQQRKHLRGLAHHLDPLILVGKQGCTHALVRAAGEALEDHELVKVKFNDFKDEKRALTEELVRRTGSVLVGTIGHVAILYREQPDPEKRKIELPG